MCRKLINLSMMLVLVFLLLPSLTLEVLKMYACPHSAQMPGACEELKVCIISHGWWWRINYKTHFIKIWILNWPDACSTQHRNNQYFAAALNYKAPLTLHWYFPEQSWLCWRKNPKHTCWKSNYSQPL